MDRIILVGGGAHSKMMIEIISETTNFEIVGITERDQSKVGGKVLDIPIVGTDDTLPEVFKKGVRMAFITVGGEKDNKVRRKLFEKVKAIGFQFPKLVHKEAVISRSATIGDGTVVMANAVINPRSTVGEDCIINTSSVVEHDTVIDDHVHIAPGAVVNGTVSVGMGAYIGSNSTIIQGIKVGPGAIVGAGAVVIKDVAAGATVVGNPARTIKG